MNLFKRIKNLWVLSDFEIKRNSSGGINVVFDERNGKNEILVQTTKMAEIIKRTTPVDEFLANEETK